MARYQVLYWQDVPSVVKAFGDDGGELKRQLPDWFQQEIDNRAMTQGLMQERRVPRAVALEGDRAGT